LDPTFGEASSQQYQGFCCFIQQARLPIFLKFYVQLSIYFLLKSTENLLSDSVLTLGIFFIIVVESFAS